MWKEVTGFRWGECITKEKKDYPKDLKNKLLQDLEEKNLNCFGLNREHKDVTAMK